MIDHWSMSTMAQSQTRFTLEDINKIKLKGFDVKLPQETITMVNKLAQLVGSPEYVRTPVFKKRSNYDSAQPRRGEKLNENDGGVTEADWEALKNYKVTETVPKDRSEADQVKRDIITGLRKMTSANYDEQKTLILDELSKVEAEHYEEVAQEIFKICTSNKFYADVYVQLYRLLCEQKEIYKSLLATTAENYLDQFKEIKQVDPKKDYDLFCELNKQNEQRVALSVFLMKILPKEHSEEMLVKLLGNIYNEFQKKNNITVVEQYMENIAEMFETCYKMYGKSLNENITSSIGNIAMLQPRALPSINNKIIFKFMDLEEMMEVDE